jgi:2'-5' RNA ligase
MRLFIAVPVSGVVKEEVRKVIDDFPVENPPWRWIPVENYHLTLRFLGETDAGMISPIGESVEGVVSEISPFEISFGPFGAFPSMRRPRVVFFKVDSGVEELSNMAHLLEREMRELGFKEEKRKFRAHLTLARIRRSLPRAVKIEMESVPPLPPKARQSVGNVVLMESILGREGAKYRELSRFELG